MDVHVSRQLVTPTETLTTARLWTDVWPGSSVRPELVNRENREELPARVGEIEAYMFREVRRLGECLITPRTLEWLVAIVHPFMDREGPHYSEPLPASRVITFVRLWSLVNLRISIRSVTYALSCVCRRMCCCNVAASEKLCLQTSH